MHLDALSALLVEEMGALDIHLKAAFGAGRNLESTLIGDDQFLSAVVKGELGFRAGCFAEQKLGFNGVRVGFGIIR
jgi:hypothetical protein